MSKFMQLQRVLAAARQVKQWQHVWYQTCEAYGEAVDGDFDELERLESDTSDASERYRDAVLELVEAITEYDGGNHAKPSG